MYPLPRSNIQDLLQGGFRGGSVVNNLPANAGGSSSTPDPGGAACRGVTSPCATTRACALELRPQRPVSPGARASQLEKSPRSDEDPAQPKVKAKLLKRKKKDLLQGVRGPKLEANPWNTKLETLVERIGCTCLPEVSHSPASVYFLIESPTVPLHELATESDWSS